MIRLSLSPNVRTQTTLININNKKLIPIRPKCEFSGEDREELGGRLVYETQTFNRKNTNEMNHNANVYCHSNAYSFR